MMMRIGLGLGKTAKRGDQQDLVVKLVTLPATAVQPGWQAPGGMQMPGTQIPGQVPGMQKPK
jgi:hypothetical protein